MDDKRGPWGNRYILAIETATSLQSIALFRGDRVLAYSQQEAEASHTKSLVMAIQEVLSAQSLQPSGLDGLAVSLGPGSFSGLRVGLATMTGFRMALDIPLVTVPTLEAMAWNLRKASLPVCPILKARPGKVYWACFRWDDEKLVRLVQDQLGSLDALVQSLSEPTLMFGDGWVWNREELFQMSKLIKEAPSEVMAASATSVGLASLARFKSGEFAEYGIGPHYIQPSYAEMKK